jgi:hypothetical protein
VAVKKRAYTLRGIRSEMHRKPDKEARSDQSHEEQTHPQLVKIDMQTEELAQAWSSTQRHVEMFRHETVYAKQAEKAACPIRALERHPNTKARMVSRNGLREKHRAATKIQSMHRRVVARARVGKRRLQKHINKQAEDHTEL